MIIYTTMVALYILYKSQYTSWFLNPNPEKTRQVVDPEPTLKHNIEPYVLFTAQIPGTLYSLY